MRLSVLIPVRDQAAFVGQAVASVLAQGERVAQLLVVDDGSQDESAAVAAAAGAEVLRRPAGGLGAALNAGIPRLHGDLIGFLDADDLWPAGRLDPSWDMLRERPELDGVFGTQSVFMHPEVERRGPPEPSRVRSALLIRKSALERVGPFREDLKAGEFIDWFSRARDAGLRLVDIPDVVLWRRSHPDNTTRRSPVGPDYLKVVKSILDRRRQET